MENEERLVLTQRIVALAPTIDGWELLPARPVRDPALQFVLRSDRGDEVPIDAESWRYVLFEYPDGKCGVVLEQPNSSLLTDEDRYTAAVICLDGLLGEATRIVRLHDIEPVLALTAEQGRRASPLAVLPQHLASLRGPAS